MRNPSKSITLLILAALVILGCNLGSNAVSTPQPEDAAQSSASDQPIEATPIASMPGWEKFSASGDDYSVEIWLPESFDGGNMESDLEVITQRLMDMGSEYEPIAEMIENNREMFALWAFDSNIGESGMLTNVNLIREQVVSAVSLDMYMDAAEKQLPSDFSRVSRETLTLNGQDAARMIFELNNQGMKEAMYIYKVGNTIWVLTFASGTNDFDARLPDFERAAETFSVQP